MKNWTLFGFKIALIVAIAVGLGGCEPEDVDPPSAMGTQAPLVLASATPFAFTPSPVPADVEREFATYRDRSSVFAIAYPSDWEIVDGSTDRRLLVRFDPPLGYGSQVTVDVTNEGQIAPQQVLERLQSYLQLNYSTKPAYRQISQDLLADGRIQAVFLYDDGKGGEGQETLTAQLVGPYFVVLRIFVSDGDQQMLTTALSSMAASLMVDPQAAWGSQVAAINPAELLMINKLLWQDRSKGTHYTGEIYNASPSDAGNIQIRAAICDKNGIVLKEVTGEAALRVIPKGATIPFSVLVEGLPSGVTICSEQITAEPARSDSTYTTALAVETNARLNPRRQLVVEGTVSNPGLTVVINIQLVVAVYNKEGTVIGFARPDLGAGLRLEPGLSEPFEFTFVNLGGQPDHFVAFVEAETTEVGASSLKPGNTLEPLPTLEPSTTAQPLGTPGVTGTPKPADE